jgi:uncharacterized membrane protein
MRKTEALMTAMVLLFLAIGLTAYQRMPEKVASHWNARGEVDGYMSRFWGVFLMPVVYAAVAVLFTLIPKIDPLRKNIIEFIEYYERFILLFSLFLLAVYVHTISWNLGYEISPNFMMPLGLGFLFYYVGVVCEHSKRNWFIGIRTPWTLSSDRVWEKTHKIGGRLFKAAGVVALIGVFFQRHAVWFILIPVLSVAVYTILYSYLEYQREEKK